MFAKFLVGGVTAAVILGAGTAAVAVSGSDSSAKPAAAAQSKQHHGKGKHKAGKLLRRAQHAQVVTKGKDGFVTHNLIKGTVSAVSATSITVRAADAKTETFAITKDTKVRARANGKGTDSTIAKVAKGDMVFVGGTGTSTLTAKHVVDRGTK